MSLIPTLHVGAQAGEVAKTVLMPGDPLRAKFIAETYLTDVIQYCSIRNMFGYTGTYKGKRISVQGSGMGMPSMGIYSYELYNVYDVDAIIRVGTAGGVDDALEIGDVCIALSASTNSNFAVQYELPGTFAPTADFGLVQRAVAAAEGLGARYRVGNVLSSDMFYNAQQNALDQWRKMGVLCVEMEAAGLYMTAAHAGKKALAVMTISDCPFKHTETTAKERETSFTRMMEIALETALETA